MVRNALCVAVVAMVLLGSTAGVSAASPRAGGDAAVTADLDGGPIDRDSIPTFYCHDLAYPKIHCFRTAAALERATRAAGQDAGLEAGTQAASAATSSIYVTIYDGVAYTGGYMHVSQNYDTLFGVGWNDRVSSFIGRSGASGELWTDWFATGTGKRFCCNVLVQSLPPGLNDAFTSVYRQ